MANAATPDGQNESIFSRFSSAISAAYKKFTGSFESQIRAGRTAVEMPALLLVPFKMPVMACCTGPYGGLCQLQADLDAPTHEKGASIVGVVKWQRPQAHVDGDSITLYEHKANSPQHHGDPIADVFAILARPNSCIMAVADGVNWGIKPRLAARCAVHGCFDHLNSKLFNSPKVPLTTQDVFHDILRAFDSGHKLIIKHGGTTTTLCVAVVVELQEPKGNNKWGLCVVTVGDSPCYVWRNEDLVVHEVTAATHLGKERNIRDSGGCLGADLGDHPDLSNLLCCFVPVTDGDIVFVVSDGISDNFDPVCLKEAVPISQSISPTTTTSKLLSGQSVDLDSPSTFTQSQMPLLHAESNDVAQHQEPQLPHVTPEQRHAISLMKLTELLKQTWQRRRCLTASLVKDTIVNYVIEVSEEKRRFLERCWAEVASSEQTVEQRRATDRKITHQVKRLPGKLDHSTICAYKVGKLDAPSTGLEMRRGRSPTHSYHMNTAAQQPTEFEHPRGSRSYSTEGGSLFYVSPNMSPGSARAANPPPTGNEPSIVSQRPANPPPLPIRQLNSSPGSTRKSDRSRIV